MNRNEKTVIENNKNTIKTLLNAEHLDISHLSNFTRATFCCLETFFTTEEVSTIVTKALDDYKNNRCDFDDNTREIVYDVLVSYNMVAFENGTLSTNKYSFILSKLSRALVINLKNRDNFNEIIGLICKAWCFNHNVHALMDALASRAKNNASANDNGGYDA